MVKLRRVCEDYICETTHQDLLKSILKYYSSNPDNWKEEWSVNPLYMVDLGHYGAGNCMCGHAIRYQHQFINSINHRTLPVGRVCVRQLNLPKYSEVLDKLERLTQMADANISMQDMSLDPIEFVKKYKKYFSPDNLKALADYGKIYLDNDYYFYTDLYRKRKYPSHVATRAKEYILKVYDIAKKFVNTIEGRSKPVTPVEVSNLEKDFANAKQLSFDF